MCRSARRDIDRRAIAASLRQAVVEPALLEHGIGEPDSAAHQNHEKDQKHDVGEPAIALALGVAPAQRLSRLVHARKRSPH